MIKIILIYLQPKQLLLLCFQKNRSFLISYSFWSCTQLVFQDTGGVTNSPQSKVNKTIRFLHLPGILLLSNKGKKAIQVAIWFTFGIKSVERITSRSMSYSQEVGSMAGATSHTIPKAYHPSYHPSSLAGSRFPCHSLVMMLRAGSETICRNTLLYILVYYKTVISWRVLRIEISFQERSALYWTLKANNYSCLLLKSLWRAWLMRFNP